MDCTSFKINTDLKLAGKILGNVGFSLHRPQIVKNNVEKFDNPKAQLGLPTLITVFSLYIM